MILYVILLWVLVGIFAYNFFIKKWERSTKFEKIWFSAVWPATLLLYLIHLINSFICGKS